MLWLISRAMVDRYTAPLTAPSMNAPSSPVGAGESLAQPSLGNVPSVRSKLNRIPQAYCAPDKMTEFSRLSRFGMLHAIIFSLEINNARVESNKF